MGDDRVIIAGALAIENKKIVYAGSMAGLPASMSGWQKTDIGGKHVYPGLIALNTQLGLSEIEAVAATIDNREIGDFTPNVRALIAYNTDSKVIPTVRSNGVLLAETTPTGGIITGRSALVQLDAWNWEDAVIRDDAGLHINWPTNRPRRFRDSSTEKERMERYEKQIVALTSYFDQAISYGKSPKKEKNLMLEALNQCINGATVFFFHADEPKSIRDAIFFIKKYKLNGAIVGGAEIEGVLDLVAKEKIPVVLNDTHRLPSTTDAPVDEAFTLPARLQAVGILYAISVNGFWQTRNLGYQAGQAVPFGLTKQQALAAITSSPAKILGVYDRMGSLDAGKDATLIIVAGDILDMQTATVEAAYIQGRIIDLDNKQKELYRRYMDKYAEQ